MNGVNLPFRLSAVVALIASVQAVYACTFATGYFHQITRLRGTVVGVNNGNLLHPFRWARQSVIRRNVKLTLFEYRWPINARSERPIVKVIKTDSNGGFDFGELPTGHYILEVAAPWGGDSLFNVEIVSLPRPIDFQVIDISPAYPDCTGGHELVPAGV
jgi:hypothetical protein